MRKHALTTLLLFSAIAANAQVFEPLALARKIFSKERPTDIEHYVIGEYEGHPNGDDIKPGVALTFSLLRQNEHEAVVGMTVKDSSGTGLDTYLFFEKDITWKMSAFRALAMTGIIEQMKHLLESMTAQQVDSVINAARHNEEDKQPLFRSREEYNFLLGNARLTLESDEDIIRHFKAHQAAFERIKNRAMKQLKKMKTDEETRTPLVKNLEREYHQLFISSVSTGGGDMGSGINFLIGGITDNTVGYLYVKDKKDLPEMSASGVIMIKEIGNNWYIYKTT
ncbi:MAG TPA: hypothetical protein VM802_09385 [Chitinophaga sp.]|uniref:hypothetical protein n=1 Tax=Chitinophaga sp. TaxID=1869181 RepID=UPI002B5EE105|nr:hypothetical protein [Chitinophaga sp.]HVI45073.1 hypothetical protein [Chitinophaga sp.]